MADFIHEDEVKTSLQIPHMLKGLWRFAKVYPWLLFFSSFAMIVTIVSARLLPQTIGYAVDHAIIPKDVHLLWMSAWIYLGLELIHAFSQFTYVYLFQRFGNRMLADIREALVEHVQSLPLDYFHRNPVGRIVTRLTNDPANLSEAFSESLINLVMNFLVLLSIVISMALISWRLTLLTLGLTPFFLWAALSVSHRIRVVLRDSKKKLSAMNSFSSERLQGIKVLQAMGAIDKTLQKFTGLSEDYKILLLRSIRLNSYMHPIMNLFTAVVIASALAGGGYFTLAGALPLGLFVAFLLHSQDFISPLREILEKYQQFQNSLTSSERIFHLFDEKTEPFQSIPTSPPAFLGKVEIRDLWFRYDEKQPWVFEGLNLQIESGEKVALIGRTGAGKSTLIALLQRFYEAPPRTLFIDNVAIEDIPRPQLRRWLGVVQQDPVLFRGTIEDNLNLGEKSLRQERMLWALKEIGAWDLLQKSGRDLNSWVEERGANLSLGERQLICFARILVFDPRFLILDEATANIDSETEALIQKAVEQITQNRTSIVIAHRLSTLRHCHRFYEIVQGKAQVPVAGL